MHVSLEGYCGSGRMANICAPMDITQDPNNFNKGVVYDLDARSSIFTELEEYKYSRNIGNKVKDLHTNEINFRSKPFKLGGFVIGLGNKETVWSIMKSAHVPVRCFEDDDCISSKVVTGGLVEFSSKSPLEFNRLYFTCVNVTVDATLSQCSNGFVIDTVPPTKGEVTVHTKKSGFITDDNLINIHWRGFADNNLSKRFGYPSSIKFFELAVGK